MTREKRGVGLRRADIFLRATERRRRGRIAWRFLGESPLYWAACATAVGILAVVPQAISQYGLLTFTGFVIPVFMALGLSLVWGFGGTLSLGQSAFYGVSAYSYGVVGINTVSTALGSQQQGNTDLAVLAGLGIPLASALLLGLTMFYARLKTVHIAIMTLVVTLFTQAFLLQTAGPQWKIGSAYLGGDNGLGRFSANIAQLPNLRLGFGTFVHEFQGPDPAFYYLVLTLLVVVFVGLRWLTSSRYGKILIAIRENPERTETFGHNVRLMQVKVFCLAAVLAGVSGILFISWGNFVSPDAFGITANIVPVIWVAVAGRTSPAAVIVATIFLGWLSQKLATQGDYSYIVLGGLLVVVATFMREGIAPALTDMVRFARKVLVTRQSGQRGGASAAEGDWPEAGMLGEATETRSTAHTRSI